MNKDLVSVEASSMCKSGAHDYFLCLWGWGPSYVVSTYKHVIFIAITHLEAFDPEKHL